MDNVKAWYQKWDECSYSSRISGYMEGQCVFPSCKVGGGREATGEALGHSLYVLFTKSSNHDLRKVNRSYHTDRLIYL